MKCVNGYEIKPLKSAAGWYMGTSTPEGWPNYRITANYYNSAEEIKKGLDKDYRYCEKNNYCSRGRVCYEW